MRMMRNTQSDIDKCLTGKCMGPFCPCLCHTSLKYDHAALALPAPRDGKPRSAGRSGARPRTREARAS
jgi:hypothetical protein